MSETEDADDLFEDVSVSERNGEYVPENEEEWRRMWCLSFASMSDPNPEKIKSFAAWLERYLRDGYTGPRAIDGEGV